MSLLRRIEARPNLCSFCKYSKRASYFNDTHCEVFALWDKRIPDEIRQLNFDHRYPHPEDAGIQFERVSLDALQDHRYFRNFTAEEIDAQFEHISERLNRRRHTSKQIWDTRGHLPHIWWLYDE